MNDDEADKTDQEEKTMARRCVGSVAAGIDVHSIFYAFVKQLNSNKRLIMKKIFAAALGLSFCIGLFSQNVGIGTSNPTKGKLVVEGTVGGVSAMFGESTPGVAIENSYPGIGLNSYQSPGSRRPIVTGYGAVINFNHNNGDLCFYSSFSSMTAGNALPVSLRMIIKANGNMGINTPNPQSALEVTGITTLNPNPFSQTAAVVTGRVKFSGAAFVLTATAANLTSSFNGIGHFGNYAIVIDNPVCNNNPDLMLMVTNKSKDPTPFAVGYDSVINKWVIHTSVSDRKFTGAADLLFFRDCDNNCQSTINPEFVICAFAPGDEFNVLVIEH